MTAARTAGAGSVCKDEHSGQTSAHVRGLSTSGFFLEHTTERTVREFVNEILLGIFFWWMNHYLSDLPRMTEDLCGSKRKKGDLVRVKLLAYFHCGKVSKK